MKDSYPKTRVLPYVLLGIVLFCLALTPMSWWSELVDLSQWSGPEPSQPRRPLVVFERFQGHPPVSITAADVARRADQVVPASQRGLSPAGNSVRRSSHRRDVWLPPKGWRPRPIQPLPDISNADPESAIDSDAEPIRVSIEPPVAQRPESPPTPLVDLNPPVSAVTSVAAKKPEAKAADTPKWPVSKSLHGLLEAAQSDPRMETWVHQIRAELKQLESARSLVDPKVETTIQALRELATTEQRTESGSSQATAITKPTALSSGHSSEAQEPLRSQELSRRISYALQQRAAVWQPLSEAAGVYARRPDQRGELSRLSRSLIEQWSTPTGSQWTEYLRLSDLTDESLDRTELGRRAEATLGRLYAPTLTQEQQSRLLQNKSIQQLDRLLRDQIAASLDPNELLHWLERYSDKPSRPHAAQLVARLQRAAADTVYTATIREIDTHYRNANFRLAVSETLINRGLPAIQQYSDRVRDQILGARVRGQNHTSTNLHVQLIPDPQHWHFWLLANGHVRSQTASTKGPVTLFNRSQSQFAAGKRLLVSQDGITVSTTSAEASTRNRLVGLRTDLDAIPVLGWALRQFAIQQQQDQRQFLRGEILRRVRGSARQRMDREIDARVARARQNLGERLVEPLETMRLDPRAVELRTTPERVIVRSRLAGPLQLAAHTPRPRARSDSLMSLQIHQSAFNNLLDRLHLGGRRLTIEELFTELSQKLGSEIQLPNEQHRGTTVQFAEEHPLEVEFADGQILLTIHLAELDNGRKKWRNFAARGYYRADVQRLDVELIRDEGIELISDKLRLGDQVALRGIFTKVFSKNTRFELLRKAIVSQPGLQHMALTQFTVRDGWVAIALGDDLPPNLAGQRRMLR